MSKIIISEMEIQELLETFEREVLIAASSKERKSLIARVTLDQPIMYIIKNQNAKTTDEQIYETRSFVDAVGVFNSI